ncbi:AMP-binding protein [Paracoccus sp. 1_MG-2023]|uniref:AMP-binding protein n=1 Tax=unclassified Paracoccus (in: a-proteobacteria) TaxID=2688777 RepID=UPI001C088DEE|nr:MULTISPECIES: AMP-binding protein [unclassified Paracoccus (in: a-proteobacteria)]MBU2958937.1 AMP-binding protein [Paracoccus sp. C2R09]MDO6669973.1 AMP-binding protein [Paracoccus sp. 1_MG-2023]
MHIITRPVLALPARNDLHFLRRVFAAWEERRVFAITRDPSILPDLGIATEDAILADTEERGWARFDHQPDLSDDPAQITFSSGTEGRPKAIVLSHRNLADVVGRLNEAMQVTDEIREYIGVPVTYSFGLGRARAVAAAGGAFFLPERFDPSQIRQMLDADEINAVSAVPSLWRLVLANPQVIGAAGAKLRWIEIGSQFMSAEDKLALRKLFPNARIVQHYGLTEASRSTFLDLASTPETHLGSVGRAQGNVEIRIAEDGAIAIRGPHVALGLLEQGGRIAPLTDDDGWLVTRDRGEIAEGYLHFLGRLDDQINIAGVKLGAEALEADIRSMLPDAGEGFAIAPIEDAMRGEAVLLAIEARIRDLAPLIEETARLCLARRGVQVGQGAGAALKVMQLDNLPRTGTGKVQRRLLPSLRDGAATPAGMMLGAADPLPVDLSEDEARVARIWARVVGDADISPSSSFYDMGGDSLSSVQIGIVMEAADMPRAPIRATMEGRCLSEVAATLTDAPPSGAAPAALPDVARRSWSITMMRAIMALSVVLSHWGPGFFGRLGLAQQAETAFSFLYRMGTPGFAAVFGIGIGYFMLPDLAEKRSSVLRRLGSAFRLVLLGMVLLAAIRLANLLVRGEPVTGLAVAHAFYGVLGYYALMLGTARWWLPPLGRLQRPIPWLLAGLPVLWLLWKLLFDLLPNQQLQSALEWPRLMLIAGGYNVFKMNAVAAAGTVVGIWLSQQKDSAEASRLMMTGGLLAMVLAVFSLIEAHGIHAFDSRDSVVFTSLPGLIFYVAFASFGTGVFLRLLMSWQGLSLGVRLPLQVLLVTGGLALPIYVFHGLVIPARNLMGGLGLGGGVALLISVGMFVAAMAYGGKRLWRMYFS